MRRIVTIFAIICLLFLDSSLLAAEQDQGILKALNSHAHNEQDELLLQGLVNTAAMLNQIEGKNLARQYQDYQYMDSARDLYQISRGFEQTLRKTIDKVHDQILRQALNQLADHISYIHRENTPYTLDQWPSNVTLCQTKWLFYQKLLTPTYESIRNIAQAYHDKLPTEQNRLFQFVETWMENKRGIDEEMSRIISQKLMQRNELKEEAEALKRQNAALRADIERANIDLTAAKAMKSALDEEDQAHRKNLAEIARQLEDKNASLREQMTQMNLALSKKKDEVTQYSVALGDVLEQTFQNPTRDGVEIEGLSKTNSFYEPIKASLTQTITSFQRQFDQSYASQKMGPEKAAQQRFILEIEKITPVKGRYLAGAKWIIKGTLSAKVSYLNIAQETDAHEQEFKFYEQGGFIAEKNGNLRATISETIQEQIPNLKRIVFERANKPSNRKLLYGQAATLLNDHPAASSIKFTQGHHLELPPPSPDCPEPALAPTPADIPPIAPSKKNAGFCLMCQREW